MITEPQYTVDTPPEDNDVVFGLPNDFLRLDNDQDQEDLELLLNTAVEWAEMWTGRVLRLTTFTAKFAIASEDYDRLGQSRPFVTLDRAPVIDVTEMRVFEQGVVGSTIITPTIAQSPRRTDVFFPKGQTFELSEDEDFPIEVDFRAGYSHQGPINFPEIAMPSAVRTAVKQHVAYMFENRGDIGDDTNGEGIPAIVKRSLQPLRLPRSANTCV